MPFASIDAIGGVGAGTAAGHLEQMRRSAAASATATDGGAGFGSMVTGAIDSLQAKQSASQALAVQAVTGDLDDVHDYTIAASEAKVTLELTAALRNKAVEAFTEIMRMQA